METNSDNTPDEDAGEETDDTSFGFWTDDGARHFNEALDEGAAYAHAHGLVSYDPEEEFYEQECEYRDPELYDPDEETLPPGEMELIFENCYIM